jgi:hypothetical protein
MKIANQKNNDKLNLIKKLFFIILIFLVNHILLIKISMIYIVFTSVFDITR